MLIAFNKPYGVLSQFTSDLPRQSTASAGGSPNRTLAEFGFPQKIYPIGRLDADSEGLLLLSDEPQWNEKLLHPRHAHEREYWAQVERLPTREALDKLQRGVMIQGRKTLPCRAWLLEPQPVVGRAALCAPPPANERVRICDAGAHGVTRPTQPQIPPRDPPIRFRKSVPDCWIGLELVEGKNRQVRRMTAAIGHPTLRLLRVRIGRFWLGDLLSGEWRVLTNTERQLLKTFNK